MNEIVSTNWLFKNKGDKNLVIFDCSWYMPNSKKNAQLDFNKKHIENSYFFDIEKISDKKNKLPHMLPSLEKFTKEVRNFNIQKKTKIIVYSKEDIIGASRAWWMFKFFGFKNIYVLNGGLKKWQKENKPTNSKKTIFLNSSFQFKIDYEWLYEKKEMIKKSIQNKNFLIIDVRSSNRFKGLESEPRKNLRSGHIPGSKNIFWVKLTSQNKTLISREKIKEQISNIKPLNKKIISTCGSGMTACVLSLSLMHALGIKSPVYDGSWTEWGSDKKLKIENEIF